jgi:hypothetical protein
MTVWPSRKSTAAAPKQQRKDIWSSFATDASSPAPTCVPIFTRSPPQIDDKPLNQPKVLSIML